MPDLLCKMSKLIFFYVSLYTGLLLGTQKGCQFEVRRISEISA
jgi:hypothetical protein